VCLRAVPPVVADAGGRLVALDGPPPGDEVLRDAYEPVASSSKPRNATGWVERNASARADAARRLACGLVQRGILSEEQWTLGILPTTPFPDG
jgi:hypothetical protein